MPGEAYDLATLIEQTEAAIRFQSFEIIRYERPAFRCYQIDERLTLDLVLIVAEKSLARSVQGKDQTLPIEHRDAVRRCVQNGAQLAKLAFLAAQLHFEVRAAACAVRPRLDERILSPFELDLFVPLTGCICSGPGRQAGMRLKGMCPFMEIGDIEHCPRK